MMSMRTRTRIGTQRSKLVAEVKYLFLNGKSSKFVYYFTHYIKLMIPSIVYRHRRKRLLSKFDRMSQSEREYILDRVEYYCKLHEVLDFVERIDTKPLDQHRLRTRAQRSYASVYFLDTFEYTRSFPSHFRWSYFFGDVDFLLPLASVTKSRPIVEENHNSVLLKLNHLRHFIWVNDSKRFEDKEQIAVFRGDIVGKSSRMDFVRKFHDSSLCDAGDVCDNSDLPAEWFKPKMTLAEHLDYKFIVSLEGNDVASNLKWVMSSNSVAVMPRPTCETWFMEGRLVPNKHYIEVAADYSDFEDRLQYYLGHPDEAKAIARNANEYCAQFRNAERETLISYLVLQRYFTQTGQLSPPRHDGVSSL